MENYGRVHHLMEWCSGPGFIGYGMMACNVCDHLTLLDKFEPAVEVAKKTAENSFIKTIDLVDTEKVYHRRVFPRTTIYHSDTCSVLSDYKLDLVVGNPPHFECKEDAIKALSAMGSPIFNDHLSEILLDPNWDAHRDMFREVSTRLSDDGTICLQLHSGGSSADTFRSMVEEAGMRITGTFNSVQYDDIYYMEVKK
jgi:methylase of polypeptide subunit release factors